MNGEDKELKDNYWNEEVIDKGYNPEDLSNFITRTTGLPIDNIPFNIFKSIVEDFKNEKFKAANLSIIKEEQKKNIATPKTPSQSQEREQEQKPDQKQKENNSNVNINKSSEIISQEILEPDTLFDYLYSPNRYTVKTKEQEPNELLFLNKANEKIEIKVSNPTVIKSGKVIKVNSYSFDIECKALHLQTNKSYSDIEWFRDQWQEIYPLVVIPALIQVSVFSNKSNDDLTYYTSHVQSFFESICKKKIWRTSKLWFDFLTVKDESEFEQWKIREKGKNFVLNPNNMNLLTTMKGSVTYDLSQSKAIKANSWNNMVAPEVNLFEQLIKNINFVSEDYANWYKHTNEISKIFIQMQKQAKKALQGKEIQKFYEDLGASFNNWSIASKSQYEFFNQDFRHFFEYAGLEYKQVINLWNKFDKKRENYERFGERWKIKKENLFANKGINKWDLEPGFQNYQEIENNKMAAFEKMCYSETLENTKNKKELSYCIHMLVDQYDKLLKYQTQRIQLFSKDVLNEKIKKFVNYNV